MAINRQIATRLLEKLGFAVESAENGQAAVDTLTEKGADYYDAVLMDIQMPGQMLPMRMRKKQLLQA